jgi:hypothetical protein
MVARDFLVAQLSKRYDNAKIQVLPVGIDTSPKVLYTNLNLIEIEPESSLPGK